ncbi:MAG: gbuB [Gammaproteobacteria bacterium]|jgi:NitT/TauT family transport system permease protein|nr:gbuB [Gammaproteobacteria bacterium]
MNFLRTADKAYPNYWDMIALILGLGMITLLAWVAKQMVVPYQLGQAIPISLDIHYLPGYALRTVLRMLIALCFSLLFTFTFATWAAKSKRAERIIIPFIDIMQSVPILGFLSITVAGFIALFPGSLLGPECAAIFVIFTSQAWNMALGFYQTVRSVPAELNEAGNMFHLSAWQRFWRIDVPFSMPGLLWNMMMSMSAGWFFVVASEAISVANQNIMLPGIGSYITLAINSMNIHAIGYAILAMFIVILLYDQLLFRPLVAWATKFKAEKIAQENIEVRSWLIYLLHRTRFLRYLGLQITYLFDRFVNMNFFRSKPIYFPHSKKMRRYFSWLWNIVLLLLLGRILVFLNHFIFHTISFLEIGHVFLLGFVTALRVLFVVVVCTVIYVPVGVWVGLRPGVAHIVQPIAQFLAAFPANLLYPLVVVLIVTYHLNVNIWVTPLMILGAQWYVLFNVVAGASVIPKDLLQVADNLALNVWLRWRRLILPAIFPYYITGAITAVGGAWNASIVAEVVRWGDHTLVATGLGAYISEYTSKGDFTNTALGIGVMCLLVLIFNRLIWRPLYVLSQQQFMLD